jgi:hypothetical protein
MPCILPDRKLLFLASKPFDTLHGESASSSPS